MTPEAHRRDQLRVALAGRMQQMKKLLFKNPVFDDGRAFVTVRDGQKWASTLMGEVVEVAETPAEEGGAPLGQQLGHAEVIAHFVGALGQVPDTFLEIEHDPACRTREGLQVELERVYGKPYDGRSIVTALMLTPAARPGEEPCRSEGAFSRHPNGDRHRRRSC